MTSNENRWLVRSIVIAQFGPAFMFSGVAIALPAMGRELQMSAASLGLVETVFIATSTAFLLPAGRIADIAPRGAVFRWMLTAFGLLSLLIGCVSNGTLVIVLRVLQGLAAAMCTAATPALLTDLVPAERRGGVFGAMLGMAYAGLALGPFAAGWIVEAFGWRCVFFFGAAQILLGGLPALLRVRDRWRKPTAGLHLPSTLLLCGGVAPIVVMIAVLEHGGSPWPWAAASAGMLGAFLWWQPRLRDPLLDLGELVRNGVLRSALLVQALLYLNAYCGIFLLSLYLQVGKGLSPRDAGLWVMTGSVVMAMVAPFAGRLSDRLRPQIVTGLGVVAIAISSALGVLLDGDTPAWWVGLVLATQGLGFGLFSSPNLSLILGSLPRERSGFASAIAAQSRGVGMFAGMAMTTAWIAMRFGGRAVGEDRAALVGTVHSAYLVLVATSCLAVVLVLTRLRRDKNGA